MEQNKFRQLIFSLGSHNSLTPIFLFPMQLAITESLHPGLSEILQMLIIIFLIDGCFFLLLFPLCDLFSVQAKCMIRLFWSYLMTFSLVDIIEMDGLDVKTLVNILGIFILS